MGRTVGRGRTGGGYFSFSLSLRERVGVREMKKSGGAAGQDGRIFVRAGIRGHGQRTWRRCSVQVAATFGVVRGKEKTMDSRLKLRA